MEYRKTEVTLPTNQKNLETKNHKDSKLRSVGRLLGHLSASPSKLVQYCSNLMSKHSFITDLTRKMRTGEALSLRKERSIFYWYNFQTHVYFLSLFYNPWSHPILTYTVFEKEPTFPYPHFTDKEVKFKGWLPKKQNCNFAAGSKGGHSILNFSWVTFLGVQWITNYFLSWK